MVGEPGGLWALDRSNGEFLWATPFPYDTPNFILSRIDVETGKNAGTRSAMVMTGYGRSHSTQLETTPDVLAEDLLAAVREVLR